jgi:hypothetical protein
VVFVLTKVGVDQCRITVQYANAFDLAISYGIGSGGIGDKNGFVRLHCNTGGGQLCGQNLSGNDGSYVPYGEWNAIYTGASTFGPIDDTTVINYWLQVRDNSGKSAETNERFQNVGCQD